MNILTVEFGKYEGTNTTAFPGMSAFRLYAHQGAKELMMQYFGATEAVWETMKLKFESSPADFDCDGRECDFHDVVIAQSLYSSSSFFGGSCSRRCPGVDTGEDMKKMVSGCDIAASTLSGKDRVSEEGCQSECLDDFRCAYSSGTRRQVTASCFPRACFRQTWSCRRVFSGDSACCNEVLIDTVQRARTVWSHRAVHVRSGKSF